MYAVLNQRKFGPIVPSMFLSIDTGVNDSFEERTRFGILWDFHGFLAFFWDFLLKSVGDFSQLFTPCGHTEALLTNIDGRNHCIEVSWPQMMQHECCLIVVRCQGIAHFKCPPIETLTPLSHLYVCARTRW